jgi:hypothetical protein
MSDYIWPNESLYFYIRSLNSHRTCEKLTSNETAEIPVTSNYLSVTYPDSKTDRMQSRPLHIESVENLRDIYGIYR